MKKNKQDSLLGGNVFQFTLTGLVVFCVALIISSSAIAYKLAAANQPKLSDAFAVDPKDKTRSIHVGPWGELVTRDIELERPTEFLTAEVNKPEPETWLFSNMKPDDVKALLSRTGLTAAQVAAAFAPEAVRADNSGTRLLPTMDFLFSLDAATRSKLCLALAGSGVNLYLDYPFIFPGGTIESIYADSRLHPDDVALLKRLVYANGNAVQLSDYPALMCQIPTVDRRVAMAKVLSRQSAVFAGLVIKPDTDIDKIAAYWGNVPNVRFTDVRPLMEALKQLPEGGNLSLFYLLPKFARDRLYTFPLPNQPGDPIMDCHWTTFNFSSETPDNRFNNPDFAVDYIRKNYYQISSPSMCGDILLLLNSRNEVKHSAVYLADDLVFTKNGNNYRQPWMIMHIPDLLATYPATPPMQVVYMRLKTD